MEKEIGSKEVKMKSQKLSYDELNQACAEMSQQIQQQGNYIQQLHKQLQEMNFMLQNKRMDYLLKIVELQGKRDTAVFNDNFYFSCISEIEESLTIPEKEDSEAKED